MVPLKNDILGIMAVSQASTQNFVPVRDIKDGVVILKDGQLCMVMLASTINFALKSVAEQEAILKQFQGFLNTIDFSLQFYIQSRKLDIGPYLDKLRGRESSQYNDLMRIQLREYIQFVDTFTSEVDIMTKNFFVIIPYKPVTANLPKGLAGFMNKRQPAPDGVKFTEYRTQLEQRVSVVERGLARIGVRTILLGNDELVELYYHIFNPGETSRAPSAS